MGIENKEVLSPPFIDLEYFMRQNTYFFTILQRFCYIIIIVVVEMVVVVVIAVAAVNIIKLSLHRELYAKAFRWINLFTHKLPDFLILKTIPSGKC